MAVVSAYNTSTSSGQLAFYAERQATRFGLPRPGQFARVRRAERRRVVRLRHEPAGRGRAAQRPSSFSFDMATSAVALFGVLTAKATGAPLAEGVAYDASGKVTTDASAVLDGGAIATFGGHKGPVSRSASSCWRGR